MKKEDRKRGGKTGGEINLEKKLEKPIFLGRLKHHNEENQRMRDKIKNYSEERKLAYYEGYADALIHAEKLHIYEHPPHKQE